MIPIQNTVPNRYQPVVTYALIAANCIVFLYQISLSPMELEFFLARYALIPARYFGPFPLRGADSPADFVPFITMMFLHGGWMHLIFNMWTLWLFGKSVEDRLGPGRYLAFYLTCGILAAITHATLTPTSTVPALGASGAIAGVMGSYVRLFPLARVIVLVPIIFIPLFFEVPAIAFIGLWFLLQVLQGTVELMMPTTGGGVAWWAHIGGFLAGVALATVMSQPERRYRSWYADEGYLGFDTSGRR
jgi:membrane associated rhomboid family serine protease